MVRNRSVQNSIRFNIVNFAKPGSLFNEGMQVLIYSQQAYNQSGLGWHRGGDQIVYYANGVKREHTASWKSYYSLSFTYNFEKAQDTTYFAYCYPYTYSQLQNYLDTIESDPVASTIVHRKTLCRTLSGNKCEYLTITSRTSIRQNMEKEGVVISARVHPGETVGSWMMQGVMEFLAGTEREAEYLRERYTFKILPMLNPDGVINGNYRCNLIGADMNRRWKKPNPELFPVVSNFKRLIKSFSNQHNLALICDLHGHSRKKNIFAYGCNIEAEPAACKLFPYILSQVSPLFSYEYSRFGVQKSKESTLRVALFKELRNFPNVFTIEASFCGPNQGEQNGKHFTIQMLKSMGRDICIALLINSISQEQIPSSVPTKQRKSAMNLRKSNKKRVNKSFSKSIAQAQDMMPEIKSIIPEFSKRLFMQELLNDQILLHQGEDEDSSSGSDSEPSEDNLETTTQPDPIPIKKEKLKKPRAVSLSKRLTYKQRPLAKCSTCGQDNLPRHKCQPKPQPLPKMLRKIVGIKTYYNLQGKRVHDQQTQTPTSFYPKILKIRANLKQSKNQLQMSPRNLSQSEFYPEDMSNVSVSASRYSSRSQIKNMLLDRLEPGSNSLLGNGNQKIFKRLRVSSIGR